jgi:hypothetical protein
MLPLRDFDDYRRFKFHKRAQLLTRTHNERLQSSLRLLVSIVRRKQVDTNRPFQFQKRSQYFIRTHNKPSSVASMCVSNPDCSPLRINA